VPIAPKVGPTVSRGSLSRPFEADTWRAIRLPAFSPIVVSKRKEQLHHIPMREVARASRTWGPQHRRVSLGPSDLKDAWHSIEPSRRFAHRNLISKDQLLPIRERRKRLGNKHMVTARGHLGKRKELCKEGQRCRVQLQRGSSRSPGAIGSDLNPVSRLE
jgi:hypothetical protein